MTKHDHSQKKDPANQNPPVDLKKKLEEMTEMAKRTMADLHNLKRRQEDERRLIITMANVDLIRTLLPILDNLERAMKHIPENIRRAHSASLPAGRHGAQAEQGSGSASPGEAELKKNSQWIQGIEMCAKQLHKALTDAGLKPMETVGQPFNPDLHEALIEGPGEKNIIIEELEKGYILSERVIRHAKVKVGNGQSRSGGA